MNRTETERKMSEERAGGRLRALDVLRGIAILGTLGTNVFVWVQLPEGAGQGGWPLGLGPANPLEAVLMQLTNGKFLSLLTLMFGMGLVIQFDAADRRRQRWPQVYLWRAALLFLDGVLHYVLVFAFDVLMSYAVTGLVVAYLLRTSRRAQRIVCAIAAGLHILVVLAGEVFVHLLFVTDEELRRRAAERLQNPAELSWWDGVVDRTTQLLANRQEALLILPMSIALFLLGGFLFRAGLFEERGGRLRRRLMIAGGCALLSDMLLALSPWLLPWPVTLSLSTRYLLAVFVALGIAAAAAAFFLDRPVGWTGRRLEDVGRLALSCYVGQNVVCMALFSDWALNLDAAMPASWGVGVAVVAYLLVTAILLVFASLWRRRFGQGPLERLWAVSYRGAMRLTPGLSRPREREQTGESNGGPAADEGSATGDGQSAGTSSTTKAAPTEARLSRSAGA